MRRFVQFMVVAVTVGLTACSAQASSIDWGSAHTITGDSDVSTSGTLFAAAAFRDAGADVTVNGVPFAASATTNLNGFNGVASTSHLTFAGNGLLYVAGPGGRAGDSSNLAWQALSSDYKSLLDDSAFFAYGNTATLTISGLTVGQKYSVQAWVNEPAWYGAARSETLDGAVTLSYNVPGINVGQYVIGTFTADAATQAISVIPASTDSGVVTAPEFNAFQVRIVPEPSTFSVLVTGMIGLLAYARRKRKQSGIHRWANS